MVKHLIGHVSRGGLFIAACTSYSGYFTGFAPEGRFGLGTTIGVEFCTSKIKVDCKKCIKIFMDKENKKICCVNPTCLELMSNRN